MTTWLKSNPAKVAAFKSSDLDIIVCFQTKGLYTGNYGKSILIP